MIRENIEIIKEANGKVFKENDPHLKSLIKRADGDWRSGKHLSMFGSKKVITEAIDLLINEEGRFKTLSTVYEESSDSDRILHMIDQIDFECKKINGKTLNLDDQRSSFPFQDDIPVEILADVIKNGPEEDIFYILCKYRGGSYYITKSSCKGMSKSRILYNATREQVSNQANFIAYHPNRFRGALTRNFFEYKIYYKKGMYVEVDYFDDFEMET